MIDSEARAVASTQREGKSEPNVKYIGSNAFQVELQRRVEAFFETTRRRDRDCPAMYFKSALLLGAFIGLYALLVFVSDAWWQAAPLAVLLGLAAGAIGFNVQHDGGHGAYSRHRWVNKLSSLSLELIGGSSYFWRWKHGVFHHTHVNVEGHDTDIDIGVLGRLTPSQRRLWFHRWQHWYMWVLYGFMAIRWHLYGDVRDIITGRCGNHRIPRPKGWDLAVFVAGKIWFISIAFVIPAMFHSLWVVATFYAVAAMVVGVVLAVVFQLAHCVEDAAFTEPNPTTNHVENAWAVHQVQGTVDFARGSRLAAFLLGGLNYQIEHHLFSRVCHVNYPAMSKIVEATCRDYGVRFNEHTTFWTGVAAHYRWLRQMGRADVAA